VKDAAAKIAKREYATDTHSTDDEVARAKAYRPRLERAIRAAISLAVKAERERCVKCVQAESTAARVGQHFVSAYQIITAINTPAKRPSRKRK
jgi:hypothetical protein